MIQGFLPTVSIAIIGLFAAKIGERLRTPLIGRKPCDGSRASGVVWSYKAEAAQQQDAWLPVRPVPHPCA